MLKNEAVTTKKLSKKEKREKLFFMSSSSKVVSMPLNGHWNNDSGCRSDLD